MRRDIHDGLGPALARLRLRVENATARLPSVDPVHDALRAASDELGMAIQEVWRITERLGPGPLGELRLSCALGQLVSGFDHARTRIELHLSYDPDPKSSGIGLRSMAERAVEILVLLVPEPTGHAPGGPAVRYADQHSGPPVPGT
ncbi:histidine kinase [Streptomyces sp. NPDC058755]|uniref:histidine kinase n=1 Tax=Streptomyces sp. NPDC058755 TaxID=3346624 RepID=UPI00369AC997